MIEAVKVKLDMLTWLALIAAICVILIFRRRNDGQK